MPGIKIVRKNRLKSVKQDNVVKEVEVVQSSNHDKLNTPDVKTKKRNSNENWDKVGTYYHESIDQNRKGNQRIFVQIAAYRDPELIPTIKDMIERADNPENLRFGICWQWHPDDEYEEEMFDFMQNDDRFQVIKVDARRGHGTCWARHSLQHLWCEDEFTLAIDSHHRFVDHWDSEMKSMYYYMQDQGHEKPLFTGYITSYKPWLENSDGTGERTLKNGFEVDPWKMIIDRFIPEGAMFFLPTSMSKDEQREPIPSRFYSAHFVFASGKMCKEVPHDPNYYFHGEEISIAVRAYTHGYDLFHPHKIIAYHEYTRKGRPHHWDDNNRSSGREFDWYEVNDQCHKRNRILFGMDGEDPNQINFGDEYGFGKVRTVEQYEEYAGINFKLRAISPDCRDYVTPSYDNITPHHETQWCKNWCIDFFVPWDELPETYEDTEFWYVGVHDADGNELKREDYDIGKIQEIYDERQDPYAARFPMSLTCPETPASYTVIPFLTGEGWLDKITKDIIDPK
jgi:hypothetical protein